MNPICYKTQRNINQRSWVIFKMDYHIPTGIDFIIESPDSRSMLQTESKNLNESVHDLLERCGYDIDGSREFWISTHRNGWTDNERAYFKITSCTTVESAYRITCETRRMQGNDPRTPMNLQEPTLEDEGIHPSVYIINQVAGYAPDFWFNTEIVNDHTGENKPIDITQNRGLSPN